MRLFFFKYDMYSTQHIMIIWLIINFILFFFAYHNIVT